MNAMTIAKVELRRFLRDRSNIFFVFVLPLMLVIFIGAQFGGEAQFQIGVVHEADDEIASAVVAAVAADDVDVVAYDDLEALVDAVGRAQLSGGIVIDPGFGHQLAALQPAEIAFIGRPDARAMALRTMVAGAVADIIEPFDAAHAAALVHEMRSPEELLGLARIAVEVVDGPKLVVEAHGGDPLAQEFAGLGQFDLGASSQLFLFVFLTSLAASATMIQSRQLGVARRMLATPMTAGGIVVGQAAGRLGIAMTQAAYIVVATTLLFQVNWGDPLAAGLVVLLFCMVAAAAAMLIGSVFRTDSQASGFGVGAGLILAALGGSMAPLEIFPDVMQRIALVTPHAWANNAMAEIVRRGGGVADVAVELTVLALYAAALLAFGTLALRRSLTK